VAIVRDNQLSAGFDKIAAGATEQEVLQKLGRPERVEKCGEFFGPLPKEEAEDCSREYLYASPLAPLLPQYYVVRFDAKNHVRSTTHTRLPNRRHLLDAFRCQITSAVSQMSSTP
jgi:hypothetical protein